jgi:hypothetical protein
VLGDVDRQERACQLLGEYEQEGEQADRDQIGPMPDTLAASGIRIVGRPPSSCSVCAPIASRARTLACADHGDNLALIHNNLPF